MKQWGKLLLIVVILLVHELAWANIGAGSSRWPLVDWLIEGYEVIGGVYIPFLCLAVLALTLANMGFGWVRIGPGFGKIILVVFGAGLGISGMAEMLGVNIAIGLVG